MFICRHCIEEDEMLNMIQKHGTSPFHKCMYQSHVMNCPESTLPYDSYCGWDAWESHQTGTEKYPCLALLMVKTPQKCDSSSHGE